MLKNNLRYIKYIFFDFDGVFTDNFVYISEKGIESVRCYRSDGLGLKMLNKYSITPFIVSTEKNVVVSKRGSKLKVEVFQGIENKSVFLKQFSNDRNIDLNLCAFVGNDINDIDAMKIVGFPIAVNDSFKDVLEIAIYKTKANGGCGAVREICEIICKSHE
jgi:3-deoxy-D-manno-octulosonate 8-phosphate phosphatase (KDO 8-P phosphatase)